MLIIEYITDNFTPERAEKIVEAIDILTEFGVEHIVENLEGVCFDSSEVDTASTIMAINELIVNGLNSVLLSHHIVSLDLTRDLNLLCDMVSTLKVAVEDYNPDYILERINFELNEANEAIDIYSALVALVTESKEDDVLEAIYRIDDRVVSSIFAILEERKVKETDILDYEGDEALELYRSFLKGRREGVVYDLMRGGVRVGQYDFKTLFTLLEEYLVDIKGDELVYEIISLTLISDYSETSIKEALEYSAKVFGDTEANGKMLYTDIKRMYMAKTGNIL